MSQFTRAHLAFEAWKHYHLVHTDPNAPHDACAEPWVRYQELASALSPRTRLRVQHAINVWWHDRHMPGGYPVKLSDDEAVQ